jgi:hypothetical protein
MMTRVEIVLSLGLLAGLAGCSAYESVYQPAEYHPVTEVRPGPGLFTGDSGVVTLMGGDKPDAPEEDEMTPAHPGEPVVIKRRRGERD